MQGWRVVHGFGCPVRGAFWCVGSSFSWSASGVGVGVGAGIGGGGLYVALNIPGRGVSVHG